MPSASIHPESSRSRSKTTHGVHKGGGGEFAGHCCGMSWTRGVFTGTGFPGVQVGSRCQCRREPRGPSRGAVVGCLLGKARDLQ